MNGAAPIEQGSLIKTIKKKWTPFYDFLKLYLYRLPRTCISGLLTHILSRRLLYRLRATAEKVTHFRYRSAIAWTATTLTLLAICATVLSISAYGFAHLGLGWFVFLWDRMILYLYALSRLYLIWWFVLPFAILLTIVAVKPWKLYRIGDWDKRNRMFVLGYSLLFAIDCIFVWQLQSTILNTTWLLALALAFVCHFLAFFTLAIFCCLANRCSSLNKHYIEHTRAIIIQGLQNADSSTRGLSSGEEVFDQIFQSSLYGFLVHKMAGNLFDILLRKWLVRLFHLGPKGRNRIYRMRCFFVWFISLLALAPLFDRLFQRHYYVMHFEMVLRDLALEEQHRTWVALNEELLHPVLEKNAFPQIFSVRDNDVSLP